MNWFINRQDSGSTASHTDADGGVTGSQSPVQSGAAEGIQAQGQRMDSPEPRLAMTTGIS
jgi:hypothetical protein